MPELPEVETIVQEMRNARLIGLRVEKVSIYWDRSLVNKSKHDNYLIFHYQVKTIPTIKHDIFIKNRLKAFGPQPSAVLVLTHKRSMLHRLIQVGLVLVLDYSLAADR